MNASDLEPDCERCFALCCVACSFSASRDFALDKPAGEPCVYLTRAYRCAIHDELRARGFGGCASYRCSGAGQKVSQVTFAGRSWRDHPEIAEEMFDAFLTMRVLHEDIALLRAALQLQLPPSLRARIDDKRVELERLTFSAVEQLSDYPVYERGREARALLREIADALPRARGGLVRIERRRGARRLAVEVG